MSNEMKRVKVKLVDEHGRPISPMDPVLFTEHPISRGVAEAACRASVGFGRFGRQFTEMVPVWWDRLRAAETPEERLTCERMINAINYALGLHRHELGARLAASNIERRDRENAAASAAAAAAEEAAAVERWRGFTCGSGS
ncbi:hypothetical protein [Paracoccus denitrificans]|uniref:hypothetical protein n=1 Tax=Paracoccus denitrificans TaxID=266 RepID=UPI0033652C4A